MVKEYGELLERDPRYGTKAKRISELTKDASEILSSQHETLESLLKRPAQARNQESRVTRVAFHSPCTLQHGQQIRGVVEALLSAAGGKLTTVPDAHLCCGSAGTYSILQPTLSRRLLTNRVAALESGSPQVIATANIGCLAHIQTGTELPVRHWIELLDDALAFEER
jgi:glycolate oxidase iron-sulfur subunit